MNGDKNVFLICIWFSSMVSGSLFLKPLELPVIRVIKVPFVMLITFGPFLSNLSTGS